MAAGGLGLAQTYLYGQQRYDQLQQAALERRLQEQKMQLEQRRWEADQTLRERELQLQAERNAPVDFLSLLPDRVRRYLYPGRQELVVPRDQASTLYGHALRQYQPPTATFDTTPRITQEIIDQYNLPQSLLNQPLSAIRELPSQTTTQGFDPLMYRDWLRAHDTGDWSAFEPGGPWHGTQIPYSAAGSFSLIPGRAIQADLDRRFGAEERQTEIDRKQAETEAQRIENELLRMFGEAERRAALQGRLLQNMQAELGIQMSQEELNRYAQLTAPAVAKALAESRIAQTEAELGQRTIDAAVEMVNQELRNAVIRGELDYAQLERFQQATPLYLQQLQAELDLTRAQTRAKELENRLLEEFGREERRESLRNQILSNERLATQIQMEEAELDRYLKLSEPVVAKAVAEAQSAELGLLFDQETYEAMVARVNQELQNLVTQGEIDQATLDRMQQLTPLLVNEAQERLLGLQLENQRQEIENQFARASFDYRLQELQYRAASAQYEIQQAQVAVEQAQQRLAIARRLEPTQVAQAEADLQLAQERLRQLQMENEQVQTSMQLFAGLDPNERDFAFKMYQTETKPFEGTGVWIPSYSDYMDNLMSAQPMDWNQFVMAYNDQMTQLLGPAPSDGLEFPWLASHWQTAYKNAKDAHFSRFSEWMISTAPAYPPIEVWYANMTSDEPLPEDELIRRWNTGELSRGPMTVTQAADQAISSAGGDIQTAIQQLQRATPEQRSAFQQRWGVSVDEVLQELRSRTGEETQALPWWRRLFGGGQ